MYELFLRQDNFPFIQVYLRRIGLRFELSQMQKRYTTVSTTNTVYMQSQKRSALIVMTYCAVSKFSSFRYLTVIDCNIIYCG
jgi:hypothetical protein